MLFEKILFPHFGVPRVLISDNGMHFIENKLEVLLNNYGAHHKHALGYHPKIVAKSRSPTVKSKPFLEKWL